MRGRLTCRCQGPLIVVVMAAAALEELSLYSSLCDPELLEELRPMAGTLKALDIDSPRIHVRTLPWRPYTDCMCMTVHRWCDRRSYKNAAETCQPAVSVQPLFRKPA
jgi:hypothetical protein